MIRLTRLPSGLRVVTERMDGVRSACFGFHVGTGSRDEPAPLAGASHFLEHLVFKGTASRTGREINELVDAVGGDMNASTGREDTSFYVRVLDEDADTGLDLLFDTMLWPLLAAPDMEVERQVILEEIAMSEDDPAERVHELWAAAAYPGHGLGRDTLGSPATVEAMDAGDVRDFWACHYRPANMVLAAAGRVDHDHVVAEAEAAFERVGIEPGTVPERTPPPAPAPAHAVLDDDTEQVHLVLGVPALDRGHPDRYALAVLDHALGGGLSSRLWQRVREERGLAYSVYSHRNAYEGAGDLGAYAACAPEHVPEVLGLFESVLDDLAVHGISDRERHVAVRHLVGESALALEDSGSRMHRLGRSVLVHGEALPVEEVAARIRSVSADDVAAVAAAVLTGPRILAAVGPLDEIPSQDWSRIDG